MRKICISRDWLFNGNASVDLPHDYAIHTSRNPKAENGAHTGYFEAGMGKYVKYLSLVNTPQHYILDVDGAYMCTTVTLNEQQLIMHPHGYTPFLVDLTAIIISRRRNHVNIIFDYILFGIRCRAIFACILIFKVFECEI